MEKHKHHKRSGETTSPSNFLFYPILFGITAIYAGGIFAIYNKINQVQPIPYLDEIYHVPQAQAYCKGNFSLLLWNNLIGFASSNRLYAEYQKQERRD